VRFVVKEVHWDRFSSQYLGLPPVSIIPPTIPTHLYPNITLTKGQEREAL